MYIQKKPLLPLFAILLALLAGCSETEMSDLTIRNGLAYKKDGGGLYSGSVTSYFPQTEKEKENKVERRVAKEGTYENGRKIGDWTTRHWNGDYQKIPYENGKRHGNAKWYYADEGIKREQRYANNMMHGGGAFYDANGALTKQVFYDRNQLRDPSPNRLAGIDKLSAEDEEDSGPGLVTTILDLVGEYL